ncbi:hypothetical protein [Streptomyces antimycoticus]|uniref:hypothetical protein n=1 Tax=Streptomyces antimycoticus TaxID=68175 RepID=UPI00381FE0E8
MARPLGAAFGGTVAAVAPGRHALIALCPRSKPADHVVPTLLGGPELEAIRDRLASSGLLTRLRGRPTRTGRRRVEAAVREGALPSYVFHGPVVLPEPARRKAVSAAIPIPNGDPAYWERHTLIARPRLPRPRVLLRDALVGRRPQRRPWRRRPWLATTVATTVVATAAAATAAGGGSD